MTKQQNEGEGNRTAARAYNEGVQKHIKTGHVEEEAKAARDSLEQEGRDLNSAESAGRDKSKGEDPLLYKSQAEIKERVREGK